MIHLTKSTEPSVLLRNKASWQTAYEAARKSGTKPANNYNHPEIKAAVKVETKNKCAYCEAQGAHVHWGDVEHILPKATHIDLVHEWSNLTYACSICNSNKLDYDDKANPLINPYTENPSSFLFAAGPLIFHNVGNSRAEITVKVLKLNRAELTEKRKEKIESINQLIDRWKKAEGALKELLRAEVINETKEDKEFSFVLERYVAARCGF